MAESFFLRRRDFLRGIAASIATSVFITIPSVVKAACNGPFYFNTTSLVEDLAPSSLSNSYFTYPHSNGFLDHDTCIIAQPQANQSIKYYRFSLRDGQVVPQAAATAPLMTTDGLGPNYPRMYYAVSKNGYMVVPYYYGILVLNLMDGSVVMNWQDPDATSSMRYNADIDISTDGTRVVATRVIYNTKVTPAAVVSSDVRIIEVPTGQVTQVFTTTEFPVDHAHFSPRDEAWVCFCDGIADTLQRMWVWHPQHANPARNVFDQASNPSPLYFTHERAMFDRLSVVAVAYAKSLGTPRGLYEINFQDNQGKLISESNRDLHCNVSPDRRWAVVSLQGTADDTISNGNINETLAERIAPRLINLCERAGGSNDPNWLTSPAGFSFSDVTLVNLRNGSRVFLFRGTNANAAQPYEVQPTISPDGRWVLVKDAESKSVIGLKLNRKTLEEFLATS